MQLDTVEKQLHPKILRQISEAPGEEMVVEENWDYELSSLTTQFGHEAPKPAYEGANQELQQSGQQIPPGEEQSRPEAKLYFRQNMPFDQLIAKLEQFAEERIDSKIAEKLRNKNFGAMYLESVDHFDSKISKILVFSERLISDLLISSVHFQPHYTDPAFEKMFKAALFCLTDPAIPELVWKVILGVQPRPHAETVLRCGMPPVNGYQRGQ